MARNEAKIKFTAETREFTAQIQAVNAAMAGLRAALKYNDAQLRNSGDAAQALKNKHTLLESALEQNRLKQEQLAQKVEAANRIYGQGSTEAQRWATELTNAKTEQEKLESALKGCEAAMQAQANAEQRVATPVQQLNAKIQDQKQKLEQLKEQFRNTALEQGTDSDAANKLKGEIDKLNAELLENETKLKEVDGALEEAGDSAEQSATGGWSKLDQICADLATQGIQKVIGALKDFAGAMVQNGIDFTSSLSNVQAISGATGDQMDKLKNKARELGKSTVFSATDVSDAFGYMAMAGWDTSSMLDGIQGVLDLAAASGEDLATTSDIVTDALTAFGMEAGEAGRLADILAAASTSANTNVSMLGESFKYVAPVAGAMGYSAEDVSVALGVMANSGIKASAAGTSLRTILTNMAKPTDEMQKAMDTLGVSLDDGNGNMKSLGEVMQDLRKGFGDLKIPAEDLQKGLEELDTQMQNGEITEEDYNKAVADLMERAYGAEGALKAQAAASLAGKQGMSGLLAIVNSSDKDFDKVTNAIKGCDGAASAMAKTANDNLGGDLKQLKSAAEELGHSIFDSLEQPMRSAVQVVTTTVIPGIQNAVNFLIQHRAALGLIAAAIGAVTAAMLLQKGVQAAKTALNWTEGAALGPLISAKLSSAAATWAQLAPYILIVAAIAAVIAIIVLCVTHWDQIKKIMVTVSETIKTKVSAAWNKLKTTLSTVVTAIKTKVTSIWNGIKSTTTSVWNGIKSVITKAVNGVKTTVSSVVTSVKSKVTSIWNGIKSTTTSVWNGIKSAVTKAVNDAKSKVSTVVTAIKTKVTSIWNNIKSTTTSVWNGIKSAITKVVNDTKSKVSTVVTAIKTKVTSIWNGIKTATSTAWNGIKTTTTTIWTGVKTTAANTWNNIKTAITKPVDSAKTAVSNTVKGIKDKVSSTFSDLQDKVKSTWNKIKSAITKPIESAKSTVKKAASKIKSIFPVNLGKICKIKLPSIHVSGGSAPWGIGGKGQKPSFSVSWHRLGAIFKKPVVFDTQYGAHGLGEAGAEVAAPLETLTSMIDRSVRDNVPQIDYGRLGAAVARACAKLDIRMELDHREVGRVVRGVR